MTLRFNRVVRMRNRNKLDLTWILIIMTTVALSYCIVAIIVGMCAPYRRPTKPGRTTDWDGRIYVDQRNGTSGFSSRSNFYKFATPRNNMCFFPTALEGAGMPKLYSAFADPVTRNVVFIGMRFPAENWTSETFLVHFESNHKRLCDPIVEDYLSYGYISQFNAVITCPIPEALYTRTNVTLTLQRIANVIRYRRYAYDNLTVCQSGVSRIQRYQLTACTMLRNMDYYVPEWITFHKFVGVQHFFLYDNAPEETSTLRQTVRALDAEGVVTVIPWAYNTQGRNAYLEMQIAHENDCLWRTRHQTKWTMKIDLNEFVQPLNPDKQKITNYLQDERFEELGAVRLQNWFFGRPGMQAGRGNGSIIEANTWRPDKPSPQNCGHDKNILQPTNVHYFQINAVKVGGAGFSMSPYDELRLVHYRLDKTRTRYCHDDVMPDFKVQDLSMLRLMQKARQSAGIANTP